VNTERVAQVTHILKQHIAFKNEPFQPRLLIARVFRTPSSWFGKLKRLHPVAFKAQIRMIETMGCVSSVGSMSPYLWLDGDGRLIGEAVQGKLIPFDVESLTDEDIVNLEIGIKGDDELLRAEYDRAYHMMLNEILS
jgi:hypothetical protein